MRSFSTFSPALRSLMRFHIAYVRTPVAAHMMGTAASAPAIKTVSTRSLMYKRLCLLCCDVGGQCVRKSHVGGLQRVWGRWEKDGCSDVLGRSACAAISMTRAALLDELDEFARMLAGVKAMRLPAKAARVAMRENMLIDVCCFGGEVWWFTCVLRKYEGRDET